MIPLRSDTPVAGGKGCTAFDVVVNPAFYEKLHSSQVMMGFCLTVVLEGLEYKNNIALDRGRLLQQYHVKYIYI